MWLDLRVKSRLVRRVWRKGATSFPCQIKLDTTSTTFSCPNLVPRVSHLTAPSSLASGGGKMRDPGNEVAIADQVKTTGTILTFWRLARLTTTVRLRRPCSFKSYSQHWMPMSAVKSFYFIKKAFPLCPFIDRFRLKRLKFLLQMFSV